MSFYLKRMLHNWHILVTLALGVILGTAILASGPILVDTVINFSLPYRLRGLDPLESNLRLTTYTMSGETQYQALDDQVRVVLADRLDRHIAEVDGLASTTWLYPWQTGQPASDQRLAISFYQGLSERVTFIAGGWPAGQAYQNNVLQVVVSEAMAEYYALQVGDQLPISNKQSAGSPTVWLSVGGIVRPSEGSEPAWLGKYSHLQNQGKGQWSAEFHAFVQQDQYFSLISQLFPSMNSRFEWNVIVDPFSFHVSDTTSMHSQIELLRADLKEFPRTFMLETSLDQVLADFSGRATIIRITMYVLIGEVLLLSLYYISMVASLAVQQIRGEFSTLSSRGASFTQLLQIQSAEAANIGILALALGPALALLMVWGLAVFGPLADIAPQELSISLPPAAWMATGFSVAVCIIGLILPVSSAVKRSVVAYSRSVGRLERSQWWQRIYLDVFALVIGLLLLWRWRFYGSLASSPGGSGRVDWLLILSPLVLLMSSAIILLRVFPPVLGWFSRLAARSRGISAPLALWQTSRYPAHVARLVLLLTLAMALGILTTGINATLDGSEFERALYAVGSDLRMSFNGLIPIHEINDYPGVDATTTAWRGTGSSSVRYHDVIPRVDLLAIEPYSFSKVTRYRDDYSAEPMGVLLGRLASDPKSDSSPLIPLPGKPASLGIWIYDQNAGIYPPWIPADLLGDLVIYAKLQTADNQLFVIKLTPLLAPEGTKDEIGWVYFESNLPILTPENYPLSFHSFWFTMFSSETFFGQMNLVLDDFSVVDQDSGEVTVFEGFEEIERIWQVKNQNSSAYFAKTLPVHSGSASLAYSLPIQLNPFGYGLMPASSTRNPPLNALVSKEFMNLTNTSVGDEIRLNIISMQVSIKIDGVVDYFPTLFDTPGHGFIILPRDALMTLLNSENRNPIYPNEIWVDSTNARVSSQVQSSSVTAVQIWDFDSQRLILKADALLLGLRSVTFLAYLLTTILSLVGFATHFYLSARQREIQFSILRAIGLSPGQMYSWLLLEQIIMIITGLTMGTLFGVLLNRLILPGLPITFGEHPAIPPFFPIEDWNSVFRLYIGFGLAFVISLGAAIWLLWRANIHRALRIGQE